MLALFFFASKQLFCQCAQQAQQQLDFASSSLLGTHAATSSPLDVSTAWLGALTLGAPDSPGVPHGGSADAKMQFVVSLVVVSVSPGTAAVPAVNTQL